MMFGCKKKKYFCKIINRFNSHGTRCAGEISAARDNGVCGVIIFLKLFFLINVQNFMRK